MDALKSLFDDFAEVQAMQFNGRRCHWCGKLYFDGFNCAGLCPTCWNDALHIGQEDYHAEDKRQREEDQIEARRKKAQ